MSYALLRQLLFLLPAETSHDLTLPALNALECSGALNLFTPNITPLPINVMGIEFPHPVGLAAGLDKNGACINALSHLGFGFVEIGTVTPKPQNGNPKPRLFRLPEHNAIINRMGFNNKGVENLIHNVKNAKFDGILGINIGKNAITPIEQANDDYVQCLHEAYAHADYITVNISSPNTQGLRNLQFGDSLSILLETLKNHQHVLAEQHNRYVPIAIKIAPDMSMDEVEDVAKKLVAHGMDGVIATNTTISRPIVHPLAAEAGGLSGAPVRELSTQVISCLYAQLGNKLPIIGVGGIVTGQDAVEKIKAGASLVQIYTGFIYKGPKLISEAVEAIRGITS